MQSIRGADSQKHTQIHKVRKIHIKTYICQKTQTPIGIHTKRETHENTQTQTEERKQTYGKHTQKETYIHIYTTTFTYTKSHISRNI